MTDRSFYKFLFLLVILLIHIVQASELEPWKLVLIERRVGGCGPTKVQEENEKSKVDFEKDDSEIICWQGVKPQCVPQSVALEYGIDLDTIEPYKIELCNDT